MLTSLLTMVAAATPVAQTRSSEASLGVTATVVRPVAIPASIGTDGAAFIVDDTAALEVVAVGATVSPRDGDRVAVTPGGTDRITITLVY